jgi:sterol desaturase/sphingolipid hydroxylase (fatty acid hydroxylase superfamily)
VIAAGRLLPYLWYPLCVGGTVAMFEWMLRSATPIAVAVYVPVTIVALVVLLLQWYFPERCAWRPSLRDVRADIAFMALVQLALPEALGAAATVALAGSVSPGVVESFWPHSAPPLVQTCFMLLAVDCMRYWLHRACHRFPLLWRLHAVHHSPEILYSLNSGRFHPLEKALHFCLDAMPFIVLGVGQEVIAGYFVIYAANGLFQHSNVRLKYGWLNYVVGSAETHRWHHARDPRIAACNFGSTTALWDVIFGTWYLPKGQQAKEVGIMDKDYPKGFIQLLVAPFRDRHRAQGSHAVQRWFANALVTMRLRLTLLIQGLRIAAAVRDPMRVQRALLERILRENRDTAFGRRHGFGETDSYETFAGSVPVGDYEALRPYIDAEIERGESALTDEAPGQYVRTSGSTGRPKDIPLVSRHLDALRRIHETSVAYQYRNCPAAFAGSILAIVSPAHEGAQRSGKPFGSASGIVAGNTPRQVQEKFVVPPEVFTIADSRVKYLLILRCALAHRDITYIGTANATTLLALMRLYREYRPRLIEDLRRGTFFLEEETPPAVRSMVRSRLKPCPQRADELIALHAALENPRIADLWPSVQAVVTWTCASAGTAVSALRCELSPGTRVLELGYIASEFRATITLGRRSGAGLPTLDTHFFEFVERERWDRGERCALTLDRIRKGVDYYIIVTTPSGLYRYFINDIVRVTGFLHRTPLLKFMQKGKGVTNLTGEKLYESQVLSAVRAAMAEIGRALRFVMMLADEETGKYHLYVEPDAGPRPLAARLAKAVDAKLARLNIEYQAKRESERLGRLDAHWLRDQAGDAFKQFCVGNGQREGQFKPVALAYRKGLGFNFERFVEA